MHVMFDIETWGTTPGSDIRSIGAVTFDPFAGLINHRTGNNQSSEFYAALNNENEHDFYRDKKTVAWWNDQGEEARAAFADPVEISQGLLLFAEWLGNLCPQDELRLWCKGPHFDVSILDAAYRIIGFDTPWHYRAPRDMRTLVDIDGLTREEEREFDHGIPHHALHDAISQAKVVNHCFRRLGLAS